MELNRKSQSETQSPQIGCDRSILTRKAKDWDCFTHFNACLTDSCLFWTSSRQTTIGFVVAARGILKWEQRPEIVCVADWLLDGRDK